MRTLLGLLSLSGTLVIGYLALTTHAGGPAPAVVNSAGQPDVIRVRMKLLELGQSERLYLATHGTYGSLEDLAREDSRSAGASRLAGYLFEAEIDGARHFRIIAIPADPLHTGWPVLSIDQTLQVVRVF